MPLYYYHLRSRGLLFEDPEGTELPDEKAARQEALLAARELLRISDTSVRDWLGRSFEIVDQDGRLVVAVPFAEAIDTVVP